jgi:5-methylcytosine-specific restriction enzyme A
MPSYLLTWNPKKWKWQTFEADYRSIRKVGYLDSGWSCGVTRRIKKDDRLFLLRQGTEPRGIVAAGVATSDPFEDVHFADKKKRAFYIDARFDVLLRPETEILPRSALGRGRLRDVHWDPQASGMSIPPDAAAELEDVWAAHLESLGLKTYRSADEIAGEEKFWEGALRRVTVNAYERDPRARAACIAHYGSNCSVCGFDFAEVFGEGTRGIHVHHLRPLAEIRKGYIVDPVADLRPVCPNCHAVIHSQSPALTIDNVKKLRRTN